MSLRGLRLGELLALAGVILVVVSLFEPWYQSPAGNLRLWDTFGPAAVLLLASLSAALAMIVSALTERSTALPVSTAVWCVLLGLIGLVAAVVRVLERPQHASSLCLGAWVGLAGAAAILAGAWEVVRDERPSRYPPKPVEPRSTP